MAGISTYVDSVKDKIVHALVEPKKLEDIWDFSKTMCNVDTIEPKLVVVVISMDKHVKIHPTISTVGETLHTSYTWSNIGFLVNIVVLGVQVD